MTERKVKIKTSWLGRAATVGSLAAGTAGRLLKTKVASLGRGKEDGQKTEAELVAIAEVIKKELGHLKGVVMKVGQMASYADGNIPESMQAVLASLQDATPPMPPETVREVFQKAFGKAPEAIFAEWEPEAFAAASIGQVHRARLKDGTRVAVKVQYPGIKDAIAADFRSAGTVAPLLKAIFHSLDIEGVLDEIKDRSLEECDYRREAENQEQFRKLFAAEPLVLVPRTFPELCTETVLTTELVEARKFRDFLMHSTQAERDVAGNVIHKFVCESIFLHEIFNADPHPGNFLFAPDGRVVFLDFGCVKRWEPGVIPKWKQMVLSAIRDDFESWKRLWAELGIAGNVKAYDFTAEYAVYRASLGTILEDREQRISRSEVAARQKIVMNSPNKRHANLPKDFVMVTRLIFGLESIVAMLNAKGNYHRNVMRVLQSPTASSVHERVVDL